MCCLNKKILTIVIPCYNAESYIKRCTNSLEGLCDEVDILFVNDGSTDSTQVLLEKWIKGTPNARIVRKENGGYSTAINTGLDNCNSDYVMFLGVDDEIISDSINKLIEKVKVSRPDILLFTTQRIFDDDNESNNLDSLTCYTKPGFYKMNAYMLDRENHGDIRILFTRDTSRWFKTSVIGDTRYFGTTGVSADGCFASLITIKSQSFEFVNEVCYLWHLHKDSVSSKHRNDARLKEEANVWGEYFSKIQECGNHQLPSVIVGQTFVYKNLINSLKKSGYDTVSDEHNNRLKGFVRWIRHSKYLSITSRLKLRCPSLYKAVIKLMTRDT